MSIRAMNWAWMQELAPTPKLILMALADSADDNGKCWPGIPHIANKCCISERTVQRTLQTFKASELIFVDRQFTRAGRQTSNMYRLRFTSDANPDRVSPSNHKREQVGDKMTGSRVTHTGTLAPDSATTPLEPQYEPKQQPLLFPHQLSAAERAIAESLVAPLAQLDAQALLDELADAIETKSIKTSPLRWFRGVLNRQRNGTFAPSGGVRILERRKSRVVQNRGGPSQILNQQTDRAIARSKLVEVKLLVSHLPRRSGTEPKKV
jgi:hypothetical protein